MHGSFLQSLYHTKHKCIIQNIQIPFMIRLNDAILSLNHVLAQSTSLQAEFSRLAHSEIVEVLREQDKANRGYILIDELVGKSNNSPEYESYLRGIFPSRVSPSVLTAHFVQNVKNESFTSIKEPKTITFRDFQEFLALEFRATHLRKEIIEQAEKYIVFEGNGINLKEFENFVGTQQLAINCLLVFEYLSHGQKCIETREDPPKNSKQLNELEWRNGNNMEKMESLLNRLQTRVKQFGNEWMIEND